jgi:hypothetical protein
MDKFFFSDKNVSNQSAHLQKILNVKDDADAKRRCRKFLIQQMKDVYKKYGKKRPPDMESIQFIDQLNKKSIKECIKIVDERKKAKTQEKRQYDTHQLDTYERARDQEIYGKRQVRVPKRPEYTAPTKAGSGGGMPGYVNDNAGGGNGYAPIPSGSGNFITATGEVGGKMYFGNQAEQLYGRGSNKDELENRMMELANNYNMKGKGGGPMNMNEGFMPNNNNGGMMAYNPNMNQPQQPPNIDFSLDGGDPRGNGNRRPNNYQYSAQPPQQFNGMPQQQQQPMMMNPMYGNNQVAPVDNSMGNLMSFDQQPQQNTNSIMATNSMNESEMKANMQKLLSERSQFDTQFTSNNKQPEQNKFNPMVSPNMQNMDINQLLMLQKMQEMMSGNNNNNFLNFKGWEQYKLNSTGAGKSEKIIEEQIAALRKELFPKKKKKNKKAKSNDDDIKIASVSNDPNNVGSLKDPKDIQKYIDIAKTVMEQDSTKYHIMNIKPEQHVEPMYYNDYLVSIKEPLSDIISFEITSLKLPPVSDNITSENNSLCFDDKKVTIQEGYYNIDKLITTLQKELNTDQLTVTKNDNNIVTIRHSEDVAFKLIGSSLLKLLGFTKELYSGRSSYKSDEKHNIKTNKLYLFVENIDDYKPIMEIDMDKDLKLPVRVLVSDKKEPLTHIIIKFKQTPNANDELYYDFKNKSHEIGCSIGYLSKKHLS